jgi:hypothetical protein
VMPLHGLAWSAVLLVLSGCGQVGPTARTTPSAVASLSSPTASAAAVSSPTASPAATPWTLACRLPVVVGTEQSAERGWVTIPGGKYTPDTTPVTGPSGSSDFQPTGDSYDWAIGAWLPVRDVYLSADGANYVTETETASGPLLHLVDAKTRKQTLITAAHGPSKGYDWTLVGYGHQGVYLGVLSVVGETPSEAPGLWLLDPVTGRFRVIDQSHAWYGISGGLAWSYSVDNAGGYTVYRLDLSTGQVSHWYTSKLFGGIVAAMPDGEIVVWDIEDSGVGHIVLLTEVGTQLPLALPSDSTFDTSGNFQIGNFEEPGVWIALNSGIALITKALGLRLMANGPRGQPLLAVGACR